MEVFLLEQSSACKSDTLGGQGAIQIRKAVGAAGCNEGGQSFC